MVHNEDKATIGAVKKTSPAVVSIVITKLLPKIKGPMLNPHSGFGPPRFFLPPNIDGLDNLPEDLIDKKHKEKIQVGGGSGFIVRPNGIILTNRHVVFDTNAEYTIITSDEREYPAKVLTRDPINDIAILKIDPQEKLPTVEIGESSRIEPGQTVIAIGNALGLFSNTVSKGIVSGLARSISASMGGMEGEQEHLRGVIQTDVAINQGNSGGPLIDLEGKVMGINTAVIFGAQNIGFAIPIDKAKKDMEDLEKYGRIVHPFIGLRYIILNKILKDKYSLPIDYGALVVQDHVPGSHAIIPNSPAHKAGIKENDIILEINKEKIDKENDLSDIIQKFKVGEEASLTVLRDNKKSEFKIVLEERK